MAAKESKLSKIKLLVSPIRDALFFASKRTFLALGGKKALKGVGKIVVIDLDGTLCKADTVEELFFRKSLLKQFEIFRR